MFGRLREDIQTIFAKDPAARSVAEILFCYPGLHAVWFHRLSSFLWRHRLKFLGRLVSHIGRFFTGIEIHPGATIGRRLFIDHGMGVLIGETSEIGNDVLMYTGAVLGGTALKKEKRHPTIGNDVVIGTGAIILGAITVGDRAKVGAGSVVTKPVPADATVVGVPGRIVEDHHEPLLNLEHGQLPDPVAEAVRFVLREQNQIEKRLKELEDVSGVIAPEDELVAMKQHVVREFSQGDGI
ncbi:MAG: serine O-acetyltransferase [Chloroflexota bacterium]